jgi:glycosyltransferase involved in cell wall biosynthesis
MVIGMLGRLHPIKAVDRVLGALAVLHRRGITARLEFAGPAQEVDYRNRLTNQAQALGLSDHFKLVGPQYGADQLAFYSRCAVLVVASHSENFSNVVIEALNIETPVVASLGTPWAELAEVGCGAWVSNEPESLANAIAPFLTNLEMRRQAGVFGRALVQRRYTWPTVTNDMAEAYLAVVRYHSQRP